MFTIAIANLDYVQVNRRLVGFQNVEPDEGVRDCVEIVILDDTEQESAETLGITYEIGGNVRVNHVLRILDNDGELT